MLASQTKSKISSSAATFLQTSCLCPIVEDTTCKWLACKLRTHKTCYAAMPRPPAIESIVPSRTPSKSPGLPKKTNPRRRQLKPDAFEATPKGRPPRGIRKIRRVPGFEPRAARRSAPKYLTLRQRVPSNWRKRIEMASWLQPVEPCSKAPTLSTRTERQSPNAQPPPARLQDIPADQATPLKTWHTWHTSTHRPLQVLKGHIQVPRVEVSLVNRGSCDGGYCQSAAAFGQPATGRQFYISKPTGAAPTLAFGWNVGGKAGHLCGTVGLFMEPKIVGSRSQQVSAELYRVYCPAPIPSQLPRAFTGMAEA